MQKRIGNGWKKESPLKSSFELNWGKNDGWMKESPLEFSFELNWGKWRGEGQGGGREKFFLQPVLTIG